VERNKKREEGCKISVAVVEKRNIPKRPIR